MKYPIVSVVCSVLFVAVNADIYLHSPRGSNNRHDENTRERTNGNRLFDSQNNNRGGYNVGTPMKYYAGSNLQIEWTNQHSCNNENSNCELILQYMCNSDLRDGTRTDTILEHEAISKDQTFGMHEDYEYYLWCSLRERNKGLFTADQNFDNKHTAKYTRQDNQGTRYGYECAEERDYYPYWQPSPWKDIAILTNNAKKCPYYQSESQNVKSRWGCYFSFEDLKKAKYQIYTFPKKSLPNNKEDCEKTTVNSIRGVWIEFPTHGLPQPDCRETEFSRDNHLGNGLDGSPNLYNWTLPNIDETKCVFRIRYNISTGDYDSWSTTADYNGNPTKLDLSDKYVLSSAEVAKNRGFVFKGNPNVKLFADANFELQLAVDTSQYGRTFQDRTHVFSIKERPNSLKGAVIHNLNVRGKRGNIVQVYPAVEYDFVPNTLNIMTGDYVHFQWTGSDKNPPNNAGQGKAGTDRNNALLLTSQLYPEGNDVPFGPGPVFGHYGNNYPNSLNNAFFLDLRKTDLIQLSFLKPNAADKDLNNADPYFNLEPVKVTTVGTYHYVCTRNNNFSNRDQKGRITVNKFQMENEALGYMGGVMTSRDGQVELTADQGVFDRLQKLTLEVWPREEGVRRMKIIGVNLSTKEMYSSNFVVLSPQTELTAPGKKFQFRMQTDPGAENVNIYLLSSDSGLSSWNKVESAIGKDGVARFTASRGGVYVAKSDSYTVLITKWFKEANLIKRSARDTV
ncbi:hypothetical protein CHS0354_008883 [Potamilus streckersoni]|uniref:Protein DD3-3 n=1 Tax=Potamilus streckersoni TaxID=2493646 RepID=A0AAE0WAL2_9BIVA|nr:hypothetical protein CHS0354_008883 [Potamilus streckersoni]